MMYVQCRLERPGQRPGYSHNIQRLVTYVPCYGTNGVAIKEGCRAVLTSDLPITGYWTVVSINNHAKPASYFETKRRERMRQKAVVYG